MRKEYQVRFDDPELNKVLFPELRFKNSCYGAYMKMGETGIMMYSYRDPKLAETYELFNNLPDMVRGLEFTQEDINGYIVSLFSDLSMPMGPLTGGEQAVMDKLYGIDSFADTLKLMHEAKQTAPEDIKEMASLIDLMLEKGGRVSVNSQKLVTENSNIFDVTDDSYMSNSSM